jgi:hypothetical protein
MEPESSLQHSQVPPVPIISPGPRLTLCLFHNTIRFYGEELLAPRPNPKLEANPFSTVCDCLFNTFAATLHIGGSSSIRNMKTHHAVVRGTHWSRQRPQYDPSIVYKEGIIVMWWPWEGINYVQSVQMAGPGGTYDTPVCVSLFTFRLHLALII